MKIYRLRVLSLICVLTSGLSLSVLVLSSHRGIVIASSSANQSASPSASLAPCPDLAIQSLRDVTPTLIADHVKLGIGGLPCNVTKFPSAATPVLGFQEGFDYFSWLTFLALNSPASGGPIGADARPVWETWKPIFDVMLPGGAEPGPWNPLNNAEVPPECGKLGPGTMVIRMDHEETYNEPFGSGPLFDQNGNYALFVIYMNEAMFNYIDPREGGPEEEKHRSLYSVAVQSHFAGPINFPSGDEHGPGAVMVKASWKILLTPEEESRYHTVSAVLYRPKRSNPCQSVPLGLIGFHVGHKTETRQQWIWTTFEHVRNVPTEQEVHDGKDSETYNFYSANDKTSAFNQTPEGPWGPNERNWDLGHRPEFKSQIVRTGSTPADIAVELRTLNQAFQGALSNSVWANYELISTQWPSDFGCSNTKEVETLPDQTCAPVPSYLANSTLETFSQPLMKTGGVPQATSSCISCHNNATTRQKPASRSDFTYILEKAQ